ncbi:MFS transporter [Kordiimonas lacus]|uniref:Fucose permease n=1 Tax=Kordiimonas lacus TaxID=637679 RepID=A0A1G6U3E0_9PROT|nr:MFS transporter [Kordiimonas lacus]SDD35075.1 Fucose permease [Kordiimonas lacus]
MLQVLKDRNFRIFWIGEFISVIGDHISMLAFPWLVLQLTGSEFMMGLVFAAQGLPRAILMLMGGAVVDRTSPRKVMLYTNVIRMVLMAVLAYLLFTGGVTIGIVFAIALAFGVADAFFYPATTSIVPSLVKKDQLKQGNALVQTTMWLGVIIGPLIAGFVIAGEASLGTHSAAAHTIGLGDDQQGLARAFALDGLTFFASALTLLFVRTRSLEKEDEGGTSMLEEIKVAVRFVWAVPAFRLGFLGIAALEFFFQAPIFVGLPALADLRFEEGAYIYGLQIAAYGSGAFLGASSAGIFKAPKDENIIRIMFSLFTFSGATIALIVLYPPYWWGMVVFFIAGCGDSWVWVHFTTLLQKRTPEKLLGRVMSLLMFMSVGLLPIAAVIMGMAFEINLEGALLVASGAIMLACGIGAFHPYATRFSVPAGVKEEVTEA